jgi:SPP1 family predicted phage head-tail adaptor
MMRAGQLKETIILQRATTTVDASGTPLETWAELATIRAQVIQSTTEEFMRGWGSSTEAATIFRIRWRDGITLADRVSFKGRNFDLKEIRELGRRAGLDLRCLATGAT